MAQNGTVGKTLLEKIDETVVSEVEKFIANKKALKKANIGWTEGNFEKSFLGRTEENVAAATLAFYRLEKDSLDTFIMDELGGRRDIHLCHFFSLIEKQSRGESGPLLLNGDPNIAYIKDKTDKQPWGVFASWSSDRGYWCVGAYPTPCLAGCEAGFRVVARNR